MCMCVCVWWGLGNWCFRWFNSNPMRSVKFPKKIWKNFIRLTKPTNTSIALFLVFNFQQYSLCVFFSVFISPFHCCCTHCIEYVKAVLSLFAYRSHWSHQYREESTRIVHCTKTKAHSFTKFGFIILLSRVNLDFISEC